MKGLLVILALAIAGDAVAQVLTPAQAGRAAVGTCYADCGQDLVRSRSAAMVPLSKLMGGRGWSSDADAAIPAAFLELYEKMAEALRSGGLWGTGLHDVPDPTNETFAEACIMWTGDLVVGAPILRPSSR